MNVLTINCGSSSLKMRLYRINEGGMTNLAGGSVESLGAGANVTFEAPNGQVTRTPTAMGDHATALRTLLHLLGDDLRRSIDAVGHRVVQGGEFTQTTIIDDAVRQDVDLAPSSAHGKTTKSCTHAMVLVRRTSA